MHLISAIQYHVYVVALCKHFYHLYIVILFLSSFSFFVVAAAAVVVVCFVFCSFKWNKEVFGLN